MPSQDRRFLPVRPAGQPGGRDGHLLCLVRDALLHLAGRADEALPLLQVKSSVSLRKVPGRTEFSAALSSARTTSGECGPPASRAPACCARCRRRTASSSSSTAAATQAGEGVSVQLSRGSHEPDPSRLRPPRARRRAPGFSPRSRRRCTSRCACRRGCGRAPRRRSEGLHAPHPLRRSRGSLRHHRHHLASRADERHACHHVWCVYGIAEGELTEEQFDASLFRRKTAIYRAGQLADRDLDQQMIHRVANAGRTPVVSLHLTASQRPASPRASTRLRHLGTPPRSP